MVLASVAIGGTLVAVTFTLGGAIVACGGDTQAIAPLPSPGTGDDQLTKDYTTGAGGGATGGSSGAAGEAAGGPDPSTTGATPTAVPDADAGGGSGSVPDAKSASDTTTDSGPG